MEGSAEPEVIAEAEFSLGPASHKPIIPRRKGLPFFNVGSIHSAADRAQGQDWQSLIETHLFVSVRKKNKEDFALDRKAKFRLAFLCGVINIRRDTIYGKQIFARKIGYRERLQKICQFPIHDP